MLPQVSNIILPSVKGPWSKIGKHIESHIRKALYEFELVPSNGKIAIALSGGKDSITMMMMLKAISGRGFIPFDLHAIHVGGEFTCGAGVHLPFLKGICKELEIPLILRESTQKLETLECYSCSRERRRLIFNAAKEIGCTTVAFGHTQDDQAQTVLMNLVQKSEFEGILPKLLMKRYGVEIIRPLILLDEQTIRNFAKAQNFLRISCQCPVGQKSMRKKIDNQITELTHLFPNARQNLASAALLYGSTKAASREF